MSACASVFATTKSTPKSPASIMLLTALPPAPPTPNTVIRGFNSRTSGTLRLIVMACLFCESATTRPLLWISTEPCGPRSPHRRRRNGTDARCRACSETLLQPPTHAGHVAVGTGGEAASSRLRLEMLHARELGIDEKADRGSEGRALRGFGKSRYA